MNEAPKIFRCPCGWQMGTIAARTIEAHKASCPCTQRPPTVPFDPDQHIENAARGIGPDHQLSPMERARVFHRLLTMPPEQLFKHMFTDQIREQLGKDETESENEKPS